MSEFIVHTIPGSPYGRAVAATLEEKGAPWRLSALAPGDQRQAAHLARHPFGKMPVLEHDGFTLYETQAILRHLDRSLPVPALTPTDLRAMARMDQVMNVNDCYLFRGCADVIVFQRVVGPRLLGLTPNEAAIAAAMPQARIVFDELSRLLGDQTFFAGDAVSLADLMVASQLDMFADAPEFVDLTAGSPSLVRWLEAMRSRPSMQATTWERIASLAKAA